MKGIKFVTDEKGKKTAVVIDLSEHGRLWEDFYDGLTVLDREDEPRTPWNKVKSELGLDRAEGA